MDRRTGPAVRLLPERADHDGQGAARPQPASDGCADPARHGGDAMPLHDVLPHPGGDQACGEGDGMTNFTNIPSLIEETLSRRGFLKTAGLLAVSVPLAEAQQAGPYPDPDYKQLDSWIVI